MIQSQQGCTSGKKLIYTRLLSSRFLSPTAISRLSCVAGGFLGFSRARRFNANARRGLAKIRVRIAEKEERRAKGFPLLQKGKDRVDPALPLTPVTKECIRDPLT